MSGLNSISQPVIRIGYSLKATHPSTSKNFTKNTVNTEKLCNFVLTNNSGYFGVITPQSLRCSIPKVFNTSHSPNVKTMSWRF